MTQQKKLTQEDLNTFRSNNIGQVLTEVARDYQQSAVEKYEQLGHKGLQLSHQAIFLHLGLEGTRLTDLAEKAGISKQSMGQVIDEVEQLGYIERIPAPSDRRAKIIRFTDRGLELIKTGTEIGVGIQQRYAEYISEERLKLLHEILADLRSEIRSHSK